MGSLTLQTKHLVVTKPNTYLHTVLGRVTTVHPPPPFPLMDVPYGP